MATAIAAMSNKLKLPGDVGHDAVDPEACEDALTYRDIPDVRGKLLEKAKEANAIVDICNTCASVLI